MREFQCKKTLTQREWLDPRRAHPLRLQLGSGFPKRMFGRKDANDTRFWGSCASGTQNSISSKDPQTVVWPVPETSRKLNAVTVQ